MGNKAFAWSRVEHGLAADRPDASLELRGVYYWAEDTGELTLCLTDTTGTAGWQYVTTGTSPSMVKLPVRGRITTPAAYTATRRATTGLPTYLTANAVGALGAHDGVTYVAGDRCLLADGTAYAGIYVVTNPGAAGEAFVLTRAADFDVSSEVLSGAVVPVSEGTVSAGKLYVCTTTGAIVLDTDALAFAVAAVTVSTPSATANVGSDTHTHTSPTSGGPSAETAVGDGTHTHTSPTSGSSGTETFGAYFPHRLPRAWALDGDGALTNGGGLIGVTPALTEQAAGSAQVFDVGTGGYQALETSVGASFRTVDWQLLPDVPAANDAVMFAFGVPVVQFGFDMTGTPQTYTGDAGKWQYSTGAGTWSDLTVHDNADGTARTGLRSFGRDGCVMITTMPADWASATYNGQTGYWVRWVVVTAANINVLGVAGNHRAYLVTADEGWMPPHACALDGAMFADAAATMHAANPVVITFWDATTGATRSASFTANRRWQRATFSGWNLTTAARLHAYCTAEDGTNEPSDALWGFSGSFASSNHTHTGGATSGPSATVNVGATAHTHTGGATSAPSATTAVASGTHTHTVT